MPSVYKGACSAATVRYGLCVTGCALPIDYSGTLRNACIGRFCWLFLSIPSSPPPNAHMSRQALVTVVTRNYLHYAAALADSCQRWQPAWELHVLLADRLPPDISLPASLSGGNVQLMYGDQLDQIANWQRFAFQYTPFELSCALKPFAMQRVLDQGCEQVTFIDADLALYAPLASITQALQSHSIALIPHLHRPLPRDGRKPIENNFLNAGTFNGGLLACRDDAVGRDFLQWWQQHLQRDCYVDVAGGVFVDQKWLNLVPGLFPSVAIVRQPGCNTGHWTLSQYPLTHDPTQGYRVGDYPLECFHFSNFLPANPYEFMHSQSRISFSSLPALEDLVRDYHAQLKRHAAEQYSQLGCQFQTLSDGTTIKPEWREAVRRDHKDLRHIANPFDVAAHPNLAGRLDAAVRRAHKWRGDWRLQLPSEQLKRQHQRRWKNYWRNLKSRWQRS